MANKFNKGNRPFKKLDVLNSEGPVILATRDFNSNDVVFKFDNGGGTLDITMADFKEFIYGGKIIVNPLDENDVYVFVNFSKDMRAKEEKIQEFLKD